MYEQVRLAAPVPFFNGAFMSSGIHVLRIARRWLTVGSALIAAGCALHGADPRRGRTDPLREPDVPPAATTSYVVETPSFALVAQSQLARDQSLQALGATAAAFHSLFGDDPPPIGVLVMDTNTYRRPVALTMPPANLATVTIMGGGLAGPDSVRSAASLNRQLRFLAASAWLTEYAMRWSVALDELGIVFTKQGRPVPRAGSFPDWLHVAVLCALTGGDEARSGRVVADDALVMPMRTLFSYRLLSWQAVLFEQRLRNSSSVDDTPANSAITADPDTRVLRGFVRQSTSVLRYLRASQGEEGLSNMFGAMVGGLDADEILARLPHPTTPEALDREWRAWMTSTASSSIAVPLRRIP